MQGGKILSTLWLIGASVLAIYATFSSPYY